MVARTLQARLNVRLLTLAFVGLAVVGGVAVLLTDRAIALSDHDRASAAAAGAHDSLVVELTEGDSPEDAVREVAASSSAEGVRLRVWLDPRRFESGGRDLPRLAPGSCATVADDDGHPWLACGGGDAAALGWSVAGAFAAPVPFASGFGAPPLPSTRSAVASSTLDDTALTSMPASFSFASSSLAVRP